MNDLLGQILIGVLSGLIVAVILAVIRLPVASRFAVGVRRVTHGLLVIGGVFFFIAIILTIWILARNREISDPATSGATQTAVWLEPVNNALTATAYDSATETALRLTQEANSSHQISEF